MAELIEYREFLLQYSLQFLRARYRGSVLGFLWTLLSPLILCISLSLVFSYINKTDLRTFGVYFFGGYMPWLFFVNTTKTGTSSVVGNTNYITRIYVPKVVFPVWATLVNVVDLVVGLAVALFLVVVFMKGPVTPALLVLPLSMLILVAFCAGLNFLFGAVTVFVRDFLFIWDSITFLLFFFSPILYPITNIPVSVRPYFNLNPIIPFLQLFQYPISKGLLPPPTAFLFSSAYTVGVLVVGTVIFTRWQKSFYLYL